jgi:hypothetical protein
MGVDNLVDKPVHKRVGLLVDFSPCPIQGKRLSAAMLDYYDQRNNHHCEYDKTDDKYCKAEPLKDGEKGSPARGCCLRLGISTRESEHERASDQRRYQQGEEKPAETNAAPLGGRNPDDDG